LLLLLLLLLLLRLRRRQLLHRHRALKRHRAQKRFRHAQWWSQWLFVLEGRFLLLQEVSLHSLPQNFLLVLHVRLLLFVHLGDRRCRLLLSLWVLLQMRLLLLLLVVCLLLLLLSLCVLQMRLVFPWLRESLQWVQLPFLWLLLVVPRLLRLCLRWLVLPRLLHLRLFRCVLQRLFPLRVLWWRPPRVRKFETPPSSRRLFLVG
jgi:hypothetical protein